MCILHVSVLQCADNHGRSTTGLSAGSGWLDRLTETGSADDAAALAAAAELSYRSNHPVSKAVASCGQAAGSSLPEVDILDFKLVPGAAAEQPRRYASIAI
jgi:cation transport ATPase